MATKKICTRCQERLAFCKNKCARCYYAVKRGNKSDFQRRLEQNVVVDGRYILGSKFIVDKEDFDRLQSYCWSDNGSGYGKNNKLGYLHRIICPHYKRVDHINQNTLDNRKENLREGWWINLLNTNKRPKPYPIYKNKQGLWFGQTKIEGKTFYVKASCNKQVVVEQIKDILGAHGRLQFYNLPTI